MNYNFTEARERGGEADDGRSDDIDELLSGYYTTAEYGDGPALAADDYSQYPTERADLADPSCSELLQSLFSHSAVDSYEDAVQELVSGRDAFITNDWKNDLQSAVRIHNIDADRLFEKDDGDGVTADDVLNELLDVDDDLVRASNPLVISELYAEKGLSATEIADLFDIQPTDVTEILRECGLIRGHSTPEPSSESDYEQNGRRGGGLRINA